MLPASLPYGHPPDTAAARKGTTVAQHRSHSLIPTILKFSGLSLPFCCAEEASPQETKNKKTLENTQSTVTFNDNRGRLLGTRSLYGTASSLDPGMQNKGPRKRGSLHRGTLVSPGLHHFGFANRDGLVETKICIWADRKA